MKRKFLIADMEARGEKADKCFTPESYIVVKVPTVKEKLALVEKFRESENDQVKNLEALESLIIEVNARATDDLESLIDSFDGLSCFADSIVIINWLNDLISKGFVPKK